MFYALHFYTIRSIYMYIHIFLLIHVVVSKLCIGQSSKCTNEHMSITPKLGKANIRFLYNARLLN